MTWLKDYLQFGEERLLWAKVADAPAAIKINVFLQSWTTKMTEVPQKLKAAFKAAKTYGLRREGLAFHRNILRQMPIWLHGEADPKIRRLIHSKVSECLRDNHLIRTVNDAEALARILRNPEHEARARYKCAFCNPAHSGKGCSNPHACYERARDLLDLLPEKCDPRKPKPEDAERDYPSLKDSQDANHDEDWITFDLAITAGGNLTDNFRIFTDGETTNNTHSCLREEPLAGTLRIATDGSCTGNGDGNARAGAGGFPCENSERNVALRLPAHIIQTNQTGELSAISEASRCTNRYLRLDVESNSRHAIDEANKLKTTHEDRDYIGIKNATIIRTMVANLRNHPYCTRF